MQVLCVCIYTEVLTLVFDMLTSEIDIRLKVSFTRELCTSVTKARSAYSASLFVRQSVPL